MTKEREWKPSDEWKEPAKIAADKERSRQKHLVQQLLRLENEDLVIGALRALGMKESSPGWNNALEAWRTYQKQRR